MEINNNTHTSARQMAEAVAKLVTPERLEAAIHFVAAAVEAQAAQLADADLAEVYANRLALTVALQQAVFKLGDVVKSTYQIYATINRLDILGL